MRQLLLLPLLTLALSAPVTHAASAPAAGYPNKPIRFITGGGPDTMARILGQKFTETWGQQVVVEERGGGGGLMSAELVSRATPDGYTLLLATTTHMMGPNVFKVGYDMSRDFAPVTLIGTIPFVLTVLPNNPVKNVQELIQYAKAKPGAMNYGSGGNGSPGHFIMELFKSRTGIAVVHVPYKSVANAVTAMLGDQIQVMFTVGPSAVPQLQAGRMKGLAVSTAQRAGVLPDLPTIAESGVSGFDAPAWNGVLVPRGTPKPVVEKLHAEIVRALKLPDVQERSRASAFDLVGSSPEAFGEFVRVELAKWAKVAKEAGTKAE